MSIGFLDATIFGRTARLALSITLLATVSWPCVAQATPAGAIWVSGAEIQDYRYEAQSTSGSSSVGFDTTTKHSGVAAFALHSGAVGQGGFATPAWGSPVTNGTVYFSAWVYIGSNTCPSGCGTSTPQGFLTLSGGRGVGLRYNSATTAVTLWHYNRQIGGAYTITTDAWHLYELKVSVDATTTADDTVEARIDGVVRGNQTTSSVDTGTQPVTLAEFGNPNTSSTAGDDVRVDDIIVTSDGYVGMDGHVIMRTADGTGHYGATSDVVAFNGAGCSSYATCWGDVPPSSSTYANDGTGNFPKFVASVADFSDFRAGPDAMMWKDTLFGCRGTWTIAKGPSGSNRNWQMLRRVDRTGAEVNIPSSGALDLTTAFDRWDDLECTMANCGPWGYCASPPCTADVDSIELGGWRNSAARSKVEEIGDVYVTCAYRRMPTEVLVKTLSGTLDLSWKAASHDQPIAESLADPVEISGCSGTSETVCDLSAAATGVVMSVAPSTNGGTPSCLVTTATGDLTGSITFVGTISTIDALELTLPQKIDLYSGPTLSRPCPTCSGATLGASGTCEGGRSDGQACVVDGTYGDLGNTSASCLPVTGSFITTMHPALSSTSTGSHSLDAAETCVGIGAIGLCHCSGQQYANECSDQMCGLDETCSDESGMGCFPDSIVRVGSASPLIAAGVGCVPATNQSLVDYIVGLPGPIAVKYNLEVTPAP